MTLALARHVELLGIRAIDSMHGLAEVRTRSFDEEVVVVAHQAVRMADEPISKTCSLDQPEKSSSVLVGKVDRSSQIPAAGDVIDAAGALDSTGRTHILEGTRRKVSCVDDGPPDA
jgi:hypothetical protein